MNTRMLSIEMVLLIFVSPAGWFATVDQITEFGHHPVNHGGLLKKCHSSVQSRPPPVLLL